MLNRFNIRKQNLRLTQLYFGHAQLTGEGPAKDRRVSEVEIFTSELINQKRLVDGTVGSLRC